MGDRHPLLLRRWPFSVVSLALAGVFVYVSRWLYSVSKQPDEFVPILGEYALQIGVIALVGAAVKELVDWRNAAREQHAKKDALRAELLRRVRKIHVGVVHSSYLMRVHNSAKTWTEESRSLILHIPTLDEIVEDLQASPGLFDKHDDIVDGVKGMRAYLERCRTEYDARHEDIDSDGQKRMPLTTSLKARSMPWTQDFVSGTGSFATDYQGNLEKATIPMREAVFGKTETKGSASGAP